jgi:LytS/YehU family sensor histidine kinase
MLAATIFFVLTIWEPTRLVILWARRHWRDEKKSRKRKIILTAILVPYSVIMSLARIYLENWLIWELPVDSISYYFSIIGINLLFILVQVALYESLFFVEQWHKAQMEAKELKKLNLQMQFDSLKLQIQPHFLFNTLNTLVGLIEVDQVRAVKFTEGLAHVYRYLLDSSDQPLIGLEEELKFTKTYFFLLKNRYPEGLYLNVVLDADDIERYQVPPLSLQLLVENAVKHNVILKARPLHIQIKIDKTDRYLLVSNNLQRKNNELRTGTGLSQLEKKLNVLNAGKLRIEENASSFSVALPLIKSNEYERIDH